MFMDRGISYFEIHQYIRKNNKINQYIHEIDILIIKYKSCNIT